MSDDRSNDARRADPTTVGPACCQALEGLFDEGSARDSLARYRRSGARDTTRRLVAALVARGVAGATLLDIGGGIGAIQHELLAAGAARAVAVDVSTASLTADRAEAERRGVGDRLTTIQGDFVGLAPGIGSADIVTLDRVVCCYPDVDALVTASAARAERLYGLVYPRDAAWTRLGIGLENLVHRLHGSAFRAFVHPEARIAALVRAQGLVPALRHEGLVWVVAIFTRPAAPGPDGAPPPGAGGGTAAQAHPA
ncbi:MAG: methyltransferase domain-containing protein [Candidatus Limnocylindrales bacterium]